MLILNLECYLIRHQTFIAPNNWFHRIRLNSKLNSFQNFEVSITASGKWEYGIYIPLTITKTKIVSKNKLFGSTDGAPFGEATLMTVSAGRVEVLSNWKTLNVSLRLLEGRSGKSISGPSARSDFKSVATGESSSDRVFYQGVDPNPPKSPPPKPSKWLGWNGWAILVVTVSVGMTLGSWLFKMPHGDSANLSPWPSKIQREDE